MLTFLVISLVVIVTPGPDTALTIRNVFAGGRRAGCATALGVATEDQLAWAIATSLGLASLLIASKPALYAVCLLGAAYLIFLGVQSLRQAFARGAMAVLDGRPANAEAPPVAGVRAGAPQQPRQSKMAVFFASVLPQFAAPSQGMLSQLVLLGGIFALLTLAWLSLYAVVLSLAGRWMRDADVRRTIDGVAGSALIALGLRVACQATHTS